MVLYFNIIHSFFSCVCALGFSYLTSHRSSSQTTGLVGENCVKSVNSWEWTILTGNNETNYKEKQPDLLDRHSSVIFNSFSCWKNMFLLPFQAVLHSTHPTTLHTSSLLLFSLTLSFHPIKQSLPSLYPYRSPVHPAFLPLLFTLSLPYTAFSLALFFFTLPDFILASFFPHPVLSQFVQPFLYTIPFLSPSLPAITLHPPFTLLCRSSTQQKQQQQQQQFR